MNVFNISHLLIAGGFDNEPTCGRPLGMRIDRDGYLIVVDAYLGIFKINVATGAYLTIINESEFVNKMRFIEVCLYM